jgi:hypothetical protein
MDFQQTGLWWLYLLYFPCLPWPMQHKLGLILCVAQLKVAKASAKIGGQCYGKTLPMKNFQKVFIIVT